MKVIKKILLAILFIILIPYQIINLFIKGFKTLSLFLSRGFYFYFEKIFEGLKKITKLSFFQNVSDYFKRRQEEPSHIVLIIIWLLMFVYLFDSFYIDKNTLIESLPDTPKAVEEEVSVEEVKDENLLLSKELNLYRIYGKYGLSDININKLKETNSDTVAWITVEGTNINYPVVQTDNNDYYLIHSYDYSYTHNGWTFMDFRNDSLMNDQNTIFYGHNLFNGTAFGSISNIFKAKSSDFRIMIITSDQNKYTYKIFSGYEIDPEVYYLQTTFYSETSYQQFLNTLVSRNVLGVDTSVSVEDKIITLSTCTDDNSGRKVIHAKLISVEEI